MYEKLVEQLGNYSKRYRSGETLGIAIAYTEDLLDEASAAIETLETLLQNYESAIDTKKRLAAKIEQLQSELEQVKRERDAAITEITRDCDNCRYWRPGTNDLCAAPPGLRCNVYCREAWKWRGAKEDKQNETD